MPVDTDLAALHDTLASIRKRALELESRFAPELRLVHPNYVDGARNLLHYLALRQFDIRDLQRQLAALGLSSLGRAEPHVMESVLAVSRILESERDNRTLSFNSAEHAFDNSRRQMDAHVRDLLGERPEKRSVSIMVTLPPRAASDPLFVQELAANGMDIARINCGHDTRADWERMIANVRRANEARRKNCRIVMDLSGPKFRTGALTPGPKVIRLRPRRDALGRVLSPRRIRCVSEALEWTGRKTAVLPVPDRCIHETGIGDILSFKDTRGRHRNLQVVAKDDRGLVAELYKTAYIATGTKLRLRRDQVGNELTFRVGELPPVEQPIVLRADDILVLTRGNRPGAPAKLDDAGIVTTPAHVSCSPGEIFDQVREGDPVRFNDGKIDGVVESVASEKISVRITHAKPAGSRLRSNRSINFPKSDLRLDGLTGSDRKNLEFVAGHADAIGLSFVRRPEDVVALQDELDKLDADQVGVIPKIETERGYSELPRILLAAMRRYPAGIMIARGDLAVECGWVRLAVLQEEILWLAEAAHLPVIWATQVLEDETRKGRPTRAEITDAAMSQRADCVMLNKGPHIVSAIVMLDDILRRMQRHQHKKSPMLSKLDISEV